MTTPGKLADLVGLDPPDARRSLLGHLDGLLELAVGRERSYLRRDQSVISTPDPDVRGAVQVVALAARLTGLDVERHQVQVGPARTDEEMLEEMAADPRYRPTLEEALRNTEREEE